MTQQPEALRIADELLALHGPTDIDERAAAELRRLHEIAERKSDALQKLWKQRDTLEAALRQALDALEYPGPSWIDGRQPAITAAKKALTGEGA